MQDKPSPREKMRAMILTSNVATRRVLASFLAKDPQFDFDVRQESKVTTAVAHYREAPVDLVLLGEEVEFGNL